MGTNALTPPNVGTLVDALRAYGVRYLTGGSAAPAHPMSPRELLIALAHADDARLRQAIAALLLVRPDIAGEARAAGEALSGRAREALVEAYVAAVYLQRAWRTRLRRYLGEQPTLPPFWIDELHLPAPDERLGRSGLAALRARQRGGATARHGAFEQVALNLFGQLVAERAASLAAA